MRWLWRARLADPRDIPADEQVHDGDTVWVQLDRGLDGTATTVRLRLKDVRAPELSQVGGKETRVEMTRLIACGFGKWPFIVETFRTSTDRNSVTTFERYVADLWLTQDFDKGLPVNVLVSNFVLVRGYPQGK